MITAYRMSAPQQESLTCLYVRGCDSPFAAEAATGSFMAGRSVTSRQAACGLPIAESIWGYSAVESTTLLT